MLRAAEHGLREERRIVKFRLRRADIEAAGKWTIHLRSTIPAFEDFWYKEYYWSGELV